MTHLSLFSSSPLISLHPCFPIPPPLPIFPSLPSSPPPPLLFFIFPSLPPSLPSSRLFSYVSLVLSSYPPSHLALHIVWQWYGTELLLLVQPTHHLCRDKHRFQPHGTREEEEEEEEAVVQVWNRAATWTLQANIDNLVLNHLLSLLKYQKHSNPS